MTLEAEQAPMDNGDTNDDEDVRVVDSPDELKQLVQSAETEHKRQKGDTDDVVYGSEVGNTCPICRAGIVEDIGGCNTCTGCNAQLKCGL